MYRRLYRLPYDPKWDEQPDKYVESANKAHVTYAIRLSDFILVNETSITKSAVDLQYAKITETDNEIESEENAYSDVFEDTEDDGISKMTIRDQYCITNNVPLSGKPWLNKLILKGIEWQKKKIISEHPLRIHLEGDPPLNNS